jgi:hypothetical protein
MSSGFRQKVVSVNFDGDSSVESSAEHLDRAKRHNAIQQVGDLCRIHATEVGLVVQELDLSGHLAKEVRPTHVEIEDRHFSSRFLRDTLAEYHQKSTNNDIAERDYAHESKPADQNSTSRNGRSRDQESCEREQKRENEGKRIHVDDFL